MQLKIGTPSIVFLFAEFKKNNPGDHEDREPQKTAVPRYGQKNDKPENRDQDPAQLPWVHLTLIEPRCPPLCAALPASIQAR